MLWVWAVNGLLWLCTKCFKCGCEEALIINFRIKEKPNWDWNWQLDVDVGPYQKKRGICSVLPSVLESVLVPGKVSQQDVAMSSSLNTTLYRGSCHGFQDWNGMAERWYSLTFLSHQIPKPHFTRVSIFQPFRRGESWKLAKVKVLRQHFH